jgi:hypothetical protein
VSKRRPQGKAAAAYVETPGLVHDPVAEHYTLDGALITRVSSVVEASGVANSYEGIPPWILATAAARGRALHLAVAYHLNGELDENSVHASILEGFLDVLQFLRFSAYQHQAGELALASRQLRFAGRPDLVGFISRERALIDLKHTAAADRVGLELQTAGYAILWEENFRERVDWRAGLWVPPGNPGRWRLVECRDRDARAMFLAALWVTEHPEDSDEAQRVLRQWASRIRLGA